ncbi:MAG: hypothetical protein HRF47_11730 [Chloroflexota bacterium]|jgi:hypothetical protein
MVDNKLLEITRDPRLPVALTLVVNGAVISGMLISEQEFFVESLRETKKQYQDRGGNWWNAIEDLSLNLSRSPTGEHYIHLANVEIHVAQGDNYIPVPALRISLEHVSAWMFGFPAYSIAVSEGAMRRRAAEVSSKRSARK